MRHFVLRLTAISVLCMRLLGLCRTVSTLAAPQQAPAQKLTLKDAEALALRNHPLLQAAHYDAEAAIQITRESSRKRTAVALTATSTPSAVTSATPVITRCVRPESSRNIRAASAASSGLPRIVSSSVTVVSAPRTASGDSRSRAAFSRNRSAEVNSR